MQINDSQNGWVMPAEWVPHAATWMAFPHNQALWENWWGVTLADVQVDFARVANAIARFEPVKMVVDPSAADRARELCGANIGMCGCHKPIARKNGFSCLHARKRRV